MGYTIYHDLHIAVSQQEIYNAITDPKHLINWWPQKCTGEPVHGAEYNFYFTKEYNWFGKVIKAEKIRRFI